MPKQNHIATMFYYLFIIPKNFVQLLDYVTNGENTLTISDITPFDLTSSILKRELINDVSFITNDGRLIILIEHQLTENPNMALRLFLYYTEIIRLWIETNNHNIYGTAKIPPLPVPEFYVVYNGSKELKSETSELEIAHKGIEIKIKVNIINISYSNLAGKEKDNILAGYAYFHSQMSAYKYQGYDLAKAYDQAKKDCEKQGYLTDYINKEDFNHMYTSIMDHANDLREYYREEVKEELRGEVKEELRGEVKEEGRQEGIIGIYYTELNLSINEISKKLSIPTEQVEKILKNLQLI